MTEFWKGLAAWLVATPFVLVVFGFLARAYINHRLTKELEAYRAGLDEQAERLRTQLSIRAHEESTMLSRVDTQRAAAIAAIWKRFNRMLTDFSSLEKFSPPQGSIAKDNALALVNLVRAVSTSSTRLTNTLVANAIYVDAITFDEVGNLAKSVARAMGPLVDREQLGDMTNWPALLARLIQLRDELLVKHKEQINKATRSLISSFRNALGTARPALPNLLDAGKPNPNDRGVPG